MNTKKFWIAIVVTCFIILIAAFTTVIVCSVPVTDPCAPLPAWAKATLIIGTWAICGSIPATLQLQKIIDLQKVSKNNVLI